MPHFTRRLETQHGHLNFYFNRIYAADGLRYHVSVTDREKRTHSFSMKQIRDEWVMMGKKTCPEWLGKMEDLFERLILEHLHSSTAPGTPGNG